jgi:UDP-3-O-[3-hydroxymyristoyl] glucosamine N-acyltransferase
MRLDALAERLGLALEGDGGVDVRAAAPLESAGPSDLAFVNSARWARALATSGAGAVILPPGVDAGGRAALRSARPRLDFARAVSLLHPAERPPAGVHPRAHVAEGARVHPEASIGANAVVGPGCAVGARSVLHPNVTLYPRVEIGADCEIHSGCVLREDTRLGDRVILQPGVILGGDGFGYEPDEGGAWFKIPHVGRVVLEDDVEIGACTTVDRGSFGETRLARGVKIDNLVQIAHNCRIGEGSIVVAQSGLAGSTVVGRRAVLMARVGAAGHLTVGDGAFVGVRAGLHKDVAPGARVWGSPQMEERTWHRAMAALARLPDALRRLRALEHRVAGRDAAPRDDGGEGD